MTKDGIEYDFTKTPYIVTIGYENLILDYRFSSLLYLNKFSKQHEENVIKDNKANFYADLTLITDIKSYNKIEKRGFYILKNNAQPFYNIELLKIKTNFDVV